MTSVPSAVSKRRFLSLVFFVSVLFATIFFQLVQLMVIHRPVLKELADKQHLVRIDVPPFRGPILDRNGKEFATNLKVPSIYAVPRMILKEEAEIIAGKLNAVLRLDRQQLVSRLRRDKAFIWLKRRVSHEDAEKIREMRIPSVGIVEESRRFYPQGDLLSQILGFTNVDNNGLEGVELLLDKQLHGRPGVRYSKRDALGREIRAFEMKSIPPVDGSTVHLTIDQHIQYLTERALERAFTTWHAKGAAAVVMDPVTGEILAMANRPTYDANRPSTSGPENKRNRAIVDMYEPGSVFKIVAASAALNEGVVKPEDKFFCENGTYRYMGSRALHDVHAYGTLTFEEVIIKSSNIGTVKIAAKLKPDVLNDYIHRFGFGQATGIDFPGEAPGFVRKPEFWSKTSPYNIPIGQEVMVTALQMATAMSVIANGGYLVKPYVISKVVDQAGVILRETKPAIKAQAIRPEVSLKMRRILERVVEEGTGKSARIEEIPAGGKTGTAQKVLPNGRGYSHSNFMSSFVGFAPVEEPKLVMIVLLDDPKPVYYGGAVAAPVFKEVMEPALLYLGYIPEKARILGAVETPKQNLPGNQPKALPASSPAVRT